VPILVDSGVLIAAIDSSDVDHAGAAALLELYAGQLLVPSTVVAETSWQLENNISVAAEAGLLDAIITGELKVIDLLADDYVRAVALIRQYADLGLGLVDASVVAIAERLGIMTIATLDRRDFAIVRPSHVTAFELVP
jgi:uncharacterized protein